MKKLSGKTGNLFNGKKLLIGALATVFISTSVVGPLAYSSTPIAHAATVKSIDCNTTSGNKQSKVVKITSASDLNSILEQYGLNGSSKDTATKKATTKKAATKKANTKKKATKKKATKKKTTKPSTTKPSTTKPSTSTPSTSTKITNGNYNANYANEVLTLVNQERSKAGLSPLKLNAAATNAAKVRAKEIVSSFSHTRPNGQSPFTALDAAGAKYGTAGENIAYGQSTPSAVMNGWMNSSGHRANILKSNFKEIGIGAYYQNGKYYWVQLFIG